MQWKLRLDWMAVVTVLVVATLAGLIVMGCGAGNVPRAGTGGSSGTVTALPITDASREFGQVVEFDAIREALENPTLSEDGRLSTAQAVYRSGLQQLALVLAQRFPAEPSVDEIVRPATTPPVGAGETLALRAARIDVALQRLFYLGLRAELADVVTLLTDGNTANDADLTNGPPRHWDRAWAYYSALDDTVVLRTSASPIEFPQFAGTVHEPMVRAFLDGQSAILFGAGASAGAASVRPTAFGKAASPRISKKQYGGGTPGGANPGTIRPTGPDVAAALRNEKLIQRKLVQTFYLSTLRESTDLVLKLEAADIPGANVARVRALEFYKALFTQVSQSGGAAAADRILAQLNTPVGSPGDFSREQRAALVDDLNRALAMGLLPEERVSAVQLLSVRAKGQR